MQAARLHEYGKPLVIDDLPTPTPGASQIVIRAEGAGFCHSDLHIISLATSSYGRRCLSPLATRMPDVIGAPE
jgi:D-arabinose 1-dehydrogenase-like Zn-dependent alcohol dehydrogenase